MAIGGFALLALAAATACGPVQVTPPTPSPAAAAACQKLAGALPAELGGVGRAETTPESPYVAVWGSGEIALRCGVPRPAAMSPTDTVTELDGIAWFNDPVRPALFTAIGREAYVEVTVSRDHVPGDVLRELAPAITATIPD